MAQYQKLTVGILFVGSGEEFAQIRRGTNVTRATVLSETEDGIHNPPLGSLYLSTDRAYLRIAEAGAAADWQKITTSAAD